MNKLFADSAQIFNDFYTSLNSRGQLVFVIMLLLLIILLGLLAFTSIITYVERKRGTIKAIKNIKKKTEEKKEIIVEKELKPDILTNNIYEEISKAVESKKNINLTDFELEQESSAIISYNELKDNINNIEFIDDEAVENLSEQKKKFTVSQVISPIFGTVKFDQNKAKDSSDLEKSNI
ncbi:MAG TPA: hypothetical protein PKY25_01235 [Bacilli bacterium]|nr:hypothetical protein [Bacilli bacterium]